MRPVTGALADNNKPVASARDAQVAAGCGSGCGCIGCSGLGEDPLVVLGKRDEEVRVHENDHLTEAGQWAQGGPEFELYTASNGRSYAIGGKVHVDVSEIAGDPAATVEKMKTIQRAALKPAAPSQQDRNVAAEAAGKEAKAMRELTEKALKDGRQPVPLFH